MKILKLSTNKGGGATTAAERLACAMRELGHTVKHMYVKQDWQCSKNTIKEDGNNVYALASMPEFLKTGLLFEHYLRGNRTQISNTYMSLWRRSAPFDEAILDYILQNNFDIVHCHWTANFISSNILSVLAVKKVKVIITGHDMNHFTGACHYDAGCGGFEIGCMECPQLKNDSMGLVTASMKEKNEVYSRLNPKFIFPSNWLDLEYKKSLIGKSLGANSSVIVRNCIDTDFFSPADEAVVASLKKKLSFGENELLIVSGAENNDEIRKGFKFFEHAFNSLNRSLFGSNVKTTITFVAFGGGDHVCIPSHPNVRYRHLGTLKEHQVRDLFRISDLLAFTSIEENFANVILEGLMCGCPVLGFSIGGIPDIVEHDENGFLVDVISESSYSKALLNLILNEKLRDLKDKTLKWRSKAYTRYSYTEIAKQILSFYDSGVEANNE